VEAKVVLPTPSGPYTILNCGLSIFPPVAEPSLLPEDEAGAFAECVLDFLHGGAVIKNLPFG
jgi:hypothetical protein